MARANLRRTLRDANVTVIHTDGSLGYAAQAPFEAISVAAGAPEIPASLLEQMSDPGRLVIPVGDRADQELRVVWKMNGRIDYRVATQCRFVPLRGGEGWQ
jgi:protein-L-isoaspartate(D-aspartate) O-methyltransferase